MTTKELREAAAINTESLYREGCYFLQPPVELVRTSTGEHVHAFAVDAHNVHYRHPGLAFIRLEESMGWQNIYNFSLPSDASLHHKSGSPI